MKVAVTLERMTLEQDRRIAEVVKREQSRLRDFIRRRVRDPGDAEDVLQDVFYKLVEANRMLMPIEHATGWLYRAARNRITDLFRKRRPERFSDTAIAGEDDDPMQWKTCCLPPMCLWLLVRGLNVAKWHERAQAARELSAA